MIDQNEKFIIGLGNPGKTYSKNRHNIGFLFIEALANKYVSKFSLKNKLKCYYSEFIHENVTYRLFMPNTYMNNSGDSVKAIIDWFKIDIDQIIIIVDDIDIPFGKIRFRKKGGSGGHNGLKSIINNLNTEEFKRIRVGIGSPPIVKNEKRSNTVSHVLGDLSKEENFLLNKIHQKIIDAIEKWNKEKDEIIIAELNSFDIKNN